MMEWSDASPSDPSAIPAGFPRRISRGRAYVYVFPCRDADVLKLGFSRDPLERLQSLHCRYFEFFDLDRGLLVETDSVRDARRIEGLCIASFVDFRTMEPLAIRSAAGGHTEWFCGIAGKAEPLLRRICQEEGLTLHAPVSAWLRVRFNDWSDALYDWSARMLEQIEYERFNPNSAGQPFWPAKALREVLDAYVALGGREIESRIPATVLDWYHAPPDSRGEG